MRITFLSGIVLREYSELPGCVEPNSLRIRSSRKRGLTTNYTKEQIGLKRFVAITFGHVFLNAFRNQQSAQEVKVHFGLLLLRFFFDFMLRSSENPPEEAICNTRRTAAPMGFTKCFISLSLVPTCRKTLVKCRVCSVTFFLLVENEMEQGLSGRLIVSLVIVKKNLS